MHKNEPRANPILIENVIKVYELKREPLEPIRELIP